MVPEVLVATVRFKNDKIFLIFPCVEITVKFLLHFYWQECCLALISKKGSWNEKSSCAHRERTCARVLHVANSCFKQYNPRRYCWNWFREEERFINLQNTNNHKRYKVPKSEKTHPGYPKKIIRRASSRKFPAQIWKKLATVGVHRIKMVGIYF